MYTSNKLSEISQNGDKQMSGIKGRFKGSFILFLLLIVSTGCAMSSKDQKRQNLKESPVDAKLAEQSLPPSAPQTMPETPREGFSQESKDSRTS